MERLAPALDDLEQWSDNTWEFFRCCRCGKLLNDAASRKRGLGPECKNPAAVDARAQTRMVEQF